MKGFTLSSSGGLRPKVCMRARTVGLELGAVQAFGGQASPGWGKLGASGRR